MPRGHNLHNPFPLQERITKLMKGYQRKVLDITNIKKYIYGYY